MQTKPSAPTPAPAPKLAGGNQPAWAKALDHRDSAWKLDFVARLTVLLGGISAILFIAAIFIFIGTQGLEFMWNRLSISELLFGNRWEPTVEPAEYGALPLIMGTAWITVVAMIVAVPLSFAAAVYIGEFAKGGHLTTPMLGEVIERISALPMHSVAAVHGTAGAKEGAY